MHLGRELVAAVAGHQVAVAHVVLEQGGQLHQHRIARGVTEAVVDLLEIVHVDQHHAQRRRVRRRVRQGLGQGGFKVAAVGQAGQVILAAQGLELAVGLTQLGGGLFDAALQRAVEVLDLAAALLQTRDQGMHRGAQLLDLLRGVAGHGGHAAAELPPRQLVGGLGQAVDGQGDPARQEDAEEPGQGQADQAPAQVRLQDLVHLALHLGLRLRHHDAPAYPRHRGVACDHVRLDEGRIELGHAGLTGQHLLDDGPLGDVLHLPHPGRVGVGDDVAVLVDDGAVALLAEVNLAPQLFDHRHPQFGQEHPLELFRVIEDRLAHDQGRGAVERTGLDAGQAPGAGFAGRTEGAVVGEQARGGFGRQVVAHQGQGPAVGGHQGDGAEILEVVDGGGQDAAIQDHVVGAVAEHLRQQPEHGPVVLDVEGEWGGDVHRQQPMLFVDLAPGTVPGRLIDPGAEHADRDQADQQKAQNQQASYRAGEEAAPFGGSPFLNLRVRHRLLWSMAGARGPLLFTRSPPNVHRAGPISMNPFTLLRSRRTCRDRRLSCP